MTPNPDDPRCPLCKDTGEVLINARADWDAEGPLWGPCDCPAGVKLAADRNAEAERQVQAFRERSKAAFNLFNPNRPRSTYDMMSPAQQSAMRDTGRLP